MAPAFVTAASPTPLGARAFGGEPLSAARPAPRRAAPATARRVAVVSMAAHLRKFLVGGNWKCNLDSKGVAGLVAEFNAGKGLDPEEVEVVLAPPMVYLEGVRKGLRGDFALAAQNCWLGKGGAYTGETSADMVKDVGAEWVILGHSERRHLPLIKEGDADIAAKARYALDAGLKVIYCIGELLEEREAGTTMDVCIRQMRAVVDVTEEKDWDNIVIAYEPVWAIGTGKVATPDQAEEVHKELRVWISKEVGQGVGDHVRILYGGSVSGGNCLDLARLPDIDGFLVGGCSLKNEFLDIIDSHRVQEGDPAAV
jgi:triosephosphate isomerase (TIM)